MSRKIAVVTGCRADYGHLYWLLKEIASDPDLALQLIVTAAHLSAKFGMTVDQIMAGGFAIDARIELPLSDDSAIGVTKAMGEATIGFADVLAHLKPDVLVLLGDRYETLAAAQAALIAKIPIAHLHGGEATYGAFDESIRNAITKMSHVHFVAEQEYADRVLQMGENPQLVFNFGGPGLDHLRKTPLLDRSTLEASLGFQFSDVNFLITYHPVTFARAPGESGVDHLLQALEAYPNAHIIFTLPNADVNNQEIADKIQSFVQQAPGKRVLLSSLGSQRYFSTVAQVNVVIGNSSSGLNEVPYFHKPTVNIGKRQEGRLMHTSVISVKEQSHDIKRGIDKALSPTFLTNLESYPSTSNVSKTASRLNPNVGNISFLIKEQIKALPLGDIIIKRFHHV